jgi:hypothetical protein
LKIILFICHWLRLNNLKSDGTYAVNDPLY